MTLNGTPDLSGLRIIIAIIVTIMWAIGVVLYYVNPKVYTIEPTVSGIMLATVTWLFGAEIKERMDKAKNGDKNGKA
jgi:uncharacterized BrkB/YihY/UPF0761 family membrane protein